MQTTIDQCCGAVSLCCKEAIQIEMITTIFHENIYEWSYHGKRFI